MNIELYGEREVLKFNRPPERVVSLVPSMTESMFDLGLGWAVVGITDYCVHPEGALASLPRLGGTKNPHIDQIAALCPDFIIANQEENTPNAVKALEAMNIPVWLTFPKTVRAAMEHLRTLAAVFRSSTAMTRITTLENSLAWQEAALAGMPARRYFCPIWMDSEQSDQRWWMTFNHETYPSDLLNLMGGTNVFALRERRYPLAADLGMAEGEDPGEKDTRYPRVTQDEIVASQPEVILLPNEPFSFDEIHREECINLFKDTPAARNQKVFLVDGSLITWHGTRMGKALHELPELFSFDEWKLP